MENAQFLRGKKWKEAKERTAFLLTLGQATQKECDWFDTQPSIISDIKYYEDSLKPVKEEKPKSKSKEK